MFVIYRVYFCGLEVDSDLFAATSPRVVDVPDKKPADFNKDPLNIASIGGSDGAAATLSKMTLAPGSNVKKDGGVSAEERSANQDRKTMLKDLKHQIESFLDTFKGIVPDEELNKKKRVLFTQLRGLGGLRGEARNKKQQDEKEAKFMGVETSGEATEPPTTDDDWENVGEIGATKEQKKARREARCEARRLKQQKKAEQKALKQAEEN